MVYYYIEASFLNHPKNKTIINIRENIERHWSSGPENIFVSKESIEYRTKSLIRARKRILNILEIYNKDGPFWYIAPNSFIIKISRE